jgi:hypothetical protein
VADGPSAQIIGSFARRCLRRPGFEGRVLASLREAIYFSDPRGQLLWLALPSHPPHRRALLMPFDTFGVSVGSPVSMVGDRLALDGVKESRVDQAAVWSAPILDRSRLVPWAALHDHVQALVERVIEMPGCRGFGQLLGHDLNGRDELRPPDGADADARRWQAMFVAGRDLLRAGRAGTAALFEPALELLGLGPGLTPAGDDFVGGMLFALNRVARAYPENVPRATPGRTVLLDRAQAATTRISFAILSDLAHGHGASPMHELLQALLHGEEPGRALAAAEAITRIGHTSGWDMLAGVVGGLSLSVGSAGR